MHGWPTGDQGVEPPAAASVAPNPAYLRPENVALLNSVQDVYPDPAVPVA